MLLLETLLQPEKGINEVMFIPYLQTNCIGTINS